VSDVNAARRTELRVSVAGADISKSLKSYLLSLSYTDNAEDESDDLQLQLQDRDGVWLENWLDKTVQADAAGKGVKIKASIVALGWRGDGKDVELDCGEFELDSIQAKGPPATITLKGVALPFGAQIRQTRKNKAWENIKLSAMSAEMAAANGMANMYESAKDPHYKRVEQSRQSDIAFLQKLCKDAGISLKATNNALVLFDQSAYEALPPVMNIKRGGGAYEKYSFAIGTADVMYASCRVRYTDPASGKLIEGAAYSEDYDDKAENNQCLEVWERVADEGEAKELAQKRLRLHNKFERTGSFTLPGAPSLVAGVTVTLESWGVFTGKYMVQQARHNVGASGYTTQISIRRVLRGY
jgi:phage protein D